MRDDFVLFWCSAAVLRAQHGESRVKYAYMAAAEPPAAPLQPQDVASQLPSDLFDEVLKKAHVPTLPLAPNTVPPDAKPLSDGSSSVVVPRMATKLLYLVLLDLLSKAMQKSPRNSA